jgi:hypothetical protein
MGTRTSINFRLDSVTSTPCGTGAPGSGTLINFVVAAGFAGVLLLLLLLLLVLLLLLLMPVESTKTGSVEL